MKCKTYRYEEGAISKLKNVCISDNMLIVKTITHETGDVETTEEIVFDEKDYGIVEYTCSSQNLIINRWNHIDNKNFIPNNMRHEFRGYSTTKAYILIQIAIMLPAIVRKQKNIYVYSHSNYSFYKLFFKMIEQSGDESDVSMYKLLLPMPGRAKYNMLNNDLMSFKTNNLLIEEVGLLR